jgi:excinuclease ABC subunit A
MVKQRAWGAIRLRGVRHNNLKNFDLDLPLGKMVVITGVSGSGKSSLAFDTLYAEGQRRYIETFSPYARQFFDRMDKPQVDRIEGIPPAIAIEQRNSVKTTRSTVGTMTEICDYVKAVWPRVSQLYCRACGKAVQKEAPRQVWDQMMTGRPEEEVLITFKLPLAEQLSLKDSLELISKQGYQRLLIQNRITRLEESLVILQSQRPESLVVVQDRLRVTLQSRARFTEACEQAYHFGKGKLQINPLKDRGNETEPVTGEPVRFSNRMHCPDCDLEYRPASAALFSFNNPLGACGACRGFGRTITIDYNLAVPDRSRTLAQGVVKPWLTGQGAECQQDLMRFCRQENIPTDIPFNELPRKWQEWVIDGEPGYGKDSEHEWPRAWYGVKGYFRWLESKSYKMHVRVLLSRYRAYQPCGDCQGKRFQPDTLLFKIQDGGGKALTIADFLALPIGEAVSLVDQMLGRCPGKRSDPLRIALNEVRSRLGYLLDVGLGYLTLDRPTRSLSGGETERVNLTTCLGTSLVNTLFVLDEPSVGLHPRDTDRLVRTLQRLRDAGNTVVVVEHEASVMRAADEIVDLGPGHGEAGGRVVFQGPYGRILRTGKSLTGRYLSGRERFGVPPRRPVAPNGSWPKLHLSGVWRHNLKDLTVEFPLGRFVCVTGVSGSGKTTLIREVLFPALQARVSQGRSPGADVRPAAHRSDEEDSEETRGEGGRAAVLKGYETLGGVLLVDQSPLGKTPRSNPVVYVGAFDDVRELFAQTELAQQRGLGPTAFSFNSVVGQCGRCRGVGFEKIEMQFLSDVFIRCTECNGRRYRPHILEIKLSCSLPGMASRPRRGGSKSGSNGAGAGKLEWSIADFLDATVDEAMVFLGEFKTSVPARRALESLRLLAEVGLGYLRTGQPINTLSGGECQRLKLVSHVAEFKRKNSSEDKPTLFLFDEPTTGLHFDDIRVLLRVFHRLVDAGHSVVVIEHNLDVIRSSDWIIDLGPEAGAEGGRVVAVGTPEQVSVVGHSHTGAALRRVGKGSVKEIGGRGAKVF